MPLTRRSPETGFVRILAVLASIDAGTSVLLSPRSSERISA